MRKLFPVAIAVLLCANVQAYEMLETKDKAVFYWWKLENFIDQHLMRVTMAGLDPEMIYKVSELNRISKKALPYEGKCFSGKFLMDSGLEMPTGWKIPWDSRMLLLEKQ